MDTTAVDAVTDDTGIGDPARATAQKGGAYVTAADGEDRSVSRRVGGGGSRLVVSMRIAVGLLGAMALVLVTGSDWHRARSRAPATDMVPLLHSTIHCL